MQSEDIHAKISNDDEMSPFAGQTLDLQIFDPQPYHLLHEILSD